MKCLANYVEFVQFQRECDIQLYKEGTESVHQRFSFATNATAHWRYNICQSSIMDRAYRHTM